MSMNFSEFIRQLGAEPRNQEPEFLRARQSSPEFLQASADADAFEEKLNRAMSLSEPENMKKGLLEISLAPIQTVTKPGWQSMAMAAGLLVVIGAAGIGWNMNRGWDSVEEYLADHYGHDGPGLVAQAGENTNKDIGKFFSRFDVEATPELANIVSIIKFCPTPDGKGIHMVLNTSEGPVSLIYMPDTEVTDQELIVFGDMRALMVKLETGSAVIIGSESQSISTLYPLIQESIIPVLRNV